MPAQVADVTVERTVNGQVSLHGLRKPEWLSTPTPSRTGARNADACCCRYRTISSRIATPSGSSPEQAASGKLIDQFDVTRQKLSQRPRQADPVPLQHHMIDAGDGQLVADRMTGLPGSDHNHRGTLVTSAITPRPIVR